MPKPICEASRIVVNGSRIGFLIITTDFAIARSCHEGAVSEENTRMKNQIITVGLSHERAGLFKDYFVLDDLELLSCDDVNEGLSWLSRNTFCLIILDVSSMSADEVQEAVGKLRSASYIPVLVLTPLDAAPSALEVGADVCMPVAATDYALFAQAMALIRRYTVYNHFDAFFPDRAILYRGDLMIDSMRHRVTVAGKEIMLLPREFRLLAYFARNPGIVLTQEQLGNAIWLGEHVYNRDVMKVVSDLRRKLSDDKETPKYIETLRGVGYRFLPPE